MEPVWSIPSVARGIRAQYAALDRLLAQGAELVGWKVGVGAPAAMERAGITAPLVGFLTSATVHPPGAAVAVTGWQRPVLEPELAVHLAADVPGGASRTQVSAAIGGLSPAIELADVDAPLEDLERVVAGDIFHRGVIVGAPDAARRADDAAGLGAGVTNHGDELAVTDDVTALPGAPLGLVAHVADWLDATGRRLRAGQVVITGSVVPLVPIAPGDAIEYRCGSLGTLSVTIAP